MNIEALEKMLASGNDSAMLRFTLGKLYFDAGEMQQAAGHLRAAVVQDSAYSAAWKMLGRALMEIDQRKDAEDSFVKGIAVAEEKGDKQAAREMQVFLRRLQKQDQEDNRK